jgi:predicted kinase
MDQVEYDDVRTLAARYLQGRGDLFIDRVRRSAVVDGHGDLLAEDIFCLADGPRILDCIEFDDDLRHLDRLDDVACLTMDLERLGSREAAQTFLDAYLEFSGDNAPASLVHHYIAYRAFMRAKVACLPHGRTTAPTGAPGRLLELAHRHLNEGRVRLVLVGGPPGTGKSTVSSALADALGWAILSSDRVRKELAGVPAEASLRAECGEGIYTSEWSERTYDELLQRAEMLLSMGESVVLDATWADARHRAQATALAERTASELTQLQCTLPPELAAARIAQRHSVSDADATVAAAVRGRFDDWPDSLGVDTRQPVDAVVAWVRHRIQPWRSTPLARSRMPAD